MKIALIGYGKMGKAIEKIAGSKGHTISHRIDIENAKEITGIGPGNTDVAIEFSHPGSAYENIRSCIMQQVPVVSGTTGWLDKKPEIETLCLEKKGTFFHASNFSIGVNIFFRINEMVARVMNHYPEYRIRITEIHHTEKKDAPSGTAITLAERILPELTGKTGWASGPDAGPSMIPVESIREGKVPGTHRVTWQSGVDEIELKHEAFSREGFATGAVMIAEWIREKTGVLEMKDFLKL